MAFGKEESIEENGKHKRRSIRELEKEDTNTALERIKKCIQEKHYGMAIGYARDFHDNPQIQLLMMQVYKEDRDYDKVIKISDRFPMNLNIQLEAINLLIQLGQYIKAIEKGERFPDVPEIQLKVEKIRKMVNSLNLEKCIKEIYRNPSLSSYLYHINLKELIDLIPDDFIKFILYTAIAERTGNTKKVNEIMAKIEKEAVLNNEKMEFIKDLKKRLESKDKGLKSNGEDFVSFYIDVLKKYKPQNVPPNKKHYSKSKNDFDKMY